MKRKKEMEKFGSARIAQLEAEKKTIEDEINEIKIAGAIKISKADQKYLEKLHEDYITKTMVEVKCKVGVMIDDDGSIVDYAEESVSQCIPDNCVKKSDIKALRLAKKKFYDGLAHLAKKYNTTSDLLEGYYC